MITLTLMQPGHQTFWFAGNVEKNNNVQRNDVNQKKKGIYYVKKLLFVLVYRK